MTTGAARIAPRLEGFMHELAGDENLPIAEIWRRVGAEAEIRRIARPSYERVRQLVHSIRSRRPRGPTMAEVLRDVSFRARPVDAILERLAGEELRKL